eukprot:756758-Hanusia_phi.AAC.1
MQPAKAPSFALRWRASDAIFMTFKGSEKHETLNQGSLGLLLEQLHSSFFMFPYLIDHSKARPDQRHTCSPNSIYPRGSYSPKPLLLYPPSLDLPCLLHLPPCIARVLHLILFSLSSTMTLGKMIKSSLNNKAPAGPAIHKF